MPFLLVALLAAGLLSPVAADAAATTGCQLPGFVSTARARPCPSSSAGPSANSLLSPIVGLVGGAVKGMLSQIVAWVDDGAAAALRLTASFIGATTRPAVTSMWFSSVYWRVAALSGLLTVPFLFAACVHAIVRSDLAMLGRAAFGYLPMAMLAVAIAAPLTALLVTATDEMCSFVSSASSHADTDFLGRAAATISGLSLAGFDPFLIFVAALVTVAATITLWLELLVRGAAVEVVVLMLPLFFAAMVWPARRVWATRAIETLVALILSKFAIVAVLTLGGAAVTHATSGPSALLTGAAIILLAVFSPWALLRLLPLHEVAAAAAGGLSQPARDAVRRQRDRAERNRQSAARDGDSADGRDPHQLAQRAALLRIAEGADGLRRGRDSSPGFDDVDLDPVTREGLRVVTGGAAPRSGGSDAGGSDAGVPTPPLLTERLDGRPRVEAPFDGRRWEGFVLGDAGDERMQPPRFAEDPAGEPSGVDEPPPPSPPPPPPPADAPAAPPPVLPPGGPVRCELAPQPAEDEAL